MNNKANHIHAPLTREDRMLHVWHSDCLSLRSIYTTSKVNIVKSERQSAFAKDRTENGRERTVVRHHLRSGW